MLAWLIDERGIEPHIPVFDKSERSDGTFSRSDFTYDQNKDLYVCPAGKQLLKYRRFPGEGSAFELNTKLEKTFSFIRFPARAGMMSNRSATQAEEIEMDAVLTQYG